MAKEVDITEAAQLYGLDVCKKKALCPFHEDRHPSLNFWKSQNAFKCFVCGEYGNVIDLTRRLTGLGVWDAVRRLNDDFNLCLNVDSPSGISHNKKFQCESDDELFLGFNTWLHESFDETFRILAFCQRQLGEFREQLLPEWADSGAPPPDLDPRLVWAFHEQEGLLNDLLEVLNNSAPVVSKINFFEKFGDAGIERIFNHG